MLLDVVYNFYGTHTVLDLMNMRLVYVLPENISVLSDEIYDHAFVFFRSPSRPTIDKRKIQKENRSHIHPVAVRKPSSYINGCALMLPQSIAVEREELLVKVGDQISRIFTFSVKGEMFVPHQLKDTVLSDRETEDFFRTVSNKPLIDICTMSCPSPFQAEVQISLL